MLFEDWFIIQNWNLWKNCSSPQQTSKQGHRQSEGETQGIKLLWKCHLNLPQPLPCLDNLQRDPVWLSGKAREWSSKMYLYLGELIFLIKCFYAMLMLFHLTYFSEFLNTFLSYAIICCHITQKYVSMIFQEQGFALFHQLKFVVSVFNYCLSTSVEAHSSISVLHSGICMLFTCWIHFLTSLLILIVRKAVQTITILSGDWML